MNSFVELSNNELQECNGGGVFVACLVVAGCFVGGVAVGAGITIGIVKFCQWIKA